MRLHSRVLLLLLVCLSFSTTMLAQDSSAYSKLYHLPDKLFTRLSTRSIDLESKLTKQTEKYLQRLARHERKLQKQLWKKDSVAAKEIFGDVSARYAAMQSAVVNGQSVYSSSLDSLQTVFRFLNQNTLPAGSNLSSEKLQAISSAYSRLQGKLNQTNVIKQQIKERQQYLKQRLQQFGLTKQFNKFKKEVYYYRAQVDEYKRMLEDLSKLESKLLQIANKIPAFKEFFSKHSMLASMFRMPGSDPIASATPIPGLQTRAAVQQTMVQRFGSRPDVSRAMQQHMQSAQSQISQLKQKVQQLGGGSSDMDMPDFKPNSQRVKSFWKRIELGANVQSVRGNSFFPVTSDLALTAGYKINDKSVAGIGVSYKMGWGQSIRNIRITHEGIGFRSFLDMKVKGSFYASGGIEYNYQQPFSSMRQLYSINSWQESGLVGVTKVVSVKSKLFKKTKIQLLWDFLSYRQVPRSQPIKFRVGYQF